ncbi:YajG family lipoprotein [Halomonas caseinilytica]|uniref:YajG family lipoprotein n=1 Tax=Halomonas caseinilytica TaxID=438744 RepID=UPI00084910F2|nr:YajG family lipoprotein [Halomonas caseinilytica]
MQRRCFLRLIALLLSVVWLTGCSAPQYLQPTPERTVAVPSVGHGQAVTVAVVDGRDGPQIGTRSGNAMSTSVITVEAGPLMPKLQAEAERALRDMGFEPTTQTAQGRPRLTLTLQRLEYGRGQSRPLIDEARLESVLVAKAENGGATYTGTYTSRRTQGYAVRPDLKDNTKMVAELLSDGLNRVFRDPELGRFLAR